MNENNKTENINGIKLPKSRVPFWGLSLPVEVLNPAGYVQVVEATKRKDLVRIRIIMKKGLDEIGRNVTILNPTEEVINKYMVLRYLVRNSSSVFVRFESVFVTGSYSRKGEVFLISNDFEIIDPQKEPILRI